jgi:hypothetical protein
VLPADFFNVVKKHSRIVLHFARSATERCKVLDKHLALLAPRHPETLFIKLDVEKCPFLCTRLGVKVPSRLLLLSPPVSSSFRLAPACNLLCENDCDCKIPV